MATPEGAPRGGGLFRGFISTLLILALLGAVGLLLADRNHRQYRLTERAGVIVVERGRYMPFGFETYAPADAALGKAYAAIEVPPGEKFIGVEVFDERADLDRALFATLSGWARRALEAKESEATERAALFIERCELLQGLAEEQRLELRRLRAEIAFMHGRRLVNDIVDRLEKAVAAFELAIELGSPQTSEARAWVDELHRRIEAYRALRPTIGVPVGSGADSPIEPTVPTTPGSDPGAAPKWRL